MGPVENPKQDMGRLGDTIANKHMQSVGAVDEESECTRRMIVVINYDRISVHHFRLM